jgi:hypothetical protein
MIESLLIGILVALVSVLISHRLTVTLDRKRSRSLEKTFYKEFNIIRDGFIHWFPTLVGEYYEPIRDNYSGLPPLDLKLLESLVVELADTDKIINPDQRKLLSRMERMIENLKKNDGNRVLYINRWLENGKEVNVSEKVEISSSISFITAKLLIDVAQGIYFLDKAMTEQKKFTINVDATILTYFEHSCAVCNMEFSSEKWNSIINRLGFA